MYVCICNAIRDTELRQAVRRCEPEAGVDALYASLGRPPQCRQCIDDAEDIIAEERCAPCLAGKATLHLPPPEQDFITSAGGIGGSYAG